MENKNKRPRIKRSRIIRVDVMDDALRAKQRREERIKYSTEKVFVLVTKEKAKYISEQTYNTFYNSGNLLNGWYILRGERWAVKKIVRESFKIETIER